MPHKYISQDEIIEKLKEGWELGMSNAISSGRSRAWMQRNMCCGGDTFDVRMATLHALLKHNKIVQKPKHEKDNYWLTRYGLPDETKQQQKEGVMGAWGCESCANDDCWDNLKAENIHEMTQQEADVSLTKCFDDKSVDKAVRLGVVVWILRHGLKVSTKYLQLAAKIAEELYNDADYIDEWKKPSVRKDHLQREIAEIKIAIENDGQGTKKHIPGLLQKMATALM